MLTKQAGLSESLSAVVVDDDLCKMYTLYCGDPHNVVMVVFSSMLQHAAAMVDSIACLHNRLAFMKAYSAAVVDNYICKTYTHTSSV
jgi:hypothetical protein